MLIFNATAFIMFVYEGTLSFDLAVLFSCPQMQLREFDAMQQQQQQQQQGQWYPTVSMHIILTS